MKILQIWKAKKTITKIALINFGVFVIIAIIIGGDAINGFTKDGHYYLKLGAYINEVSHPVFIYSKIHFYILIVNYVVAFVWEIISFSKKRRKNDRSKPHRKINKLKHNQQR